jgi:hypothetical protein
VGNRIHERGNPPTSSPPHTVDRPSNRSNAPRQRRRANVVTRVYHQLTIFVIKTMFPQVNPGVVRRMQPAVNETFHTVTDEYKKVTKMLSSLNKTSTVSNKSATTRHLPQPLRKSP